ncbi:MAG: hypothetical protein AAFQ66_14420, partial [Pseudomonadota bacterium]
MSISSAKYRVLACAVLGRVVAFFGDAGGEPSTFSAGGKFKSVPRCRVFTSADLGRVVCLLVGTGGR